MAIKLGIKQGRYIFIYKRYKNILKSIDMLNRVI